MRFKDISAILATWVAIIGAAIGGVTAISEYRAQGQRTLDQRVLQTFHMYEAFRNSDMLVRRARFDQMSAHDPDLDFWINYFDTVQACVDSQLCDAELVHQLFRPYAIASLDEVSCRIAAVRELEQGYNLPKPQGHGLLAIAGRDLPACTEPPPAAARTVTAATQRPRAEPVAAPPAETPATPTAGRGGTRGSTGEPAATTPTDASTPVRGGGRGSASGPTQAAPASSETTPPRGRGG